MRGCKRMNKERDYFFDNLKAVLIFLVVLGHFLLPIHGDNPLVVVKRLIYVFHMPLFVFISGYFAKKIYKNGQYNFKKILYLLKAYVVFVVAIQIVYAIAGFEKFTEIDFFSQSGAPWYLFAMIVWYLTIPLVRKCKAVPVLLRMWVTFYACHEYWYLDRFSIWAIFWSRRHWKKHCSRNFRDWLFPVQRQSASLFWHMEQG